MGGFVLLLFIAGIFVLGGFSGWISHKGQTQQVYDRYQYIREMEEYRRLRNIQLRKEAAVANREIVDMDKNPGYRASVDEYIAGQFNCPAYPQDPDDERIKHIGQ